MGMGRIDQRSIELKDIAPFLWLLPWTISLEYCLGLLPWDIALNTCAKRWVWRGIEDKQFREGVELPESMAEGNSEAAPGDFKRVGGGQRALGRFGGL